MKTVVIAAFVLFVNSTNIRAQTVTSSCIPADSIYWKYKKTADKLAISRCLKINDTYKDSIAINKQISSMYLNVLTAVYNATALPARDTIVFFNVTLNTKYWPYAALNNVLIEADSSKTWVSNLRQNIFPCGNTALDNLFSRYYLKATGSSIIFPPNQFNPFTIRVSIKTDTNCYTNKLCDKFNAMYQQGIGNASPQSVFSDTYNITDSINVNFTELTYSIGWGDCMAGCIYRRYWKFRVSNNCSVEYMGSYGAALPPAFFTGIHDVSIASTDWKVYPNPSRSSLYIRSDFTESQSADIKFVSHDGRVLFLKEAFNIQSDYIDVSSFARGIYFLKISHENHAVIKKIILE